MGIESTIIPSKGAKADESTLTLSGGSTMSIKDLGVTTAKLAVGVTDEVTITNNATNLSVKDGGITPAKLSELKYTFCGDEALAPSGGTTTKTLTLSRSASTDVIEFEALFYHATGTNGTLSVTFGVNDGSAKTVALTTAATTGTYIFRGAINATNQCILQTGTAAQHAVGTTAVNMASAATAYITATFNNGGGGGGHLLAAFIRVRKV